MMPLQQTVPLHLQRSFPPWLLYRHQPQFKWFDVQVSILKARVSLAWLFDQLMIDVADLSTGSNFYMGLKHSNVNAGPAVMLSPYVMDDLPELQFISQPETEVVTSLLTRAYQAFMEAVEAGVVHSIVGFATLTMLVKGVITSPTRVHRNKTIVQATASTPVKVEEATPTSVVNEGSTSVTMDVLGVEEKIEGVQEEEAKFVNAVSSRSQSKGNSMILNPEIIMRGAAQMLCALQEEMVADAEEKEKAQHHGWLF
ncbi:hypothetical protein H0H87_001410 [Tephrocybe sp. NHM501043]|nr:hypothetical protein H0H87_001410 [Tephrocybe sp. NHM501043]